MVKEKQTIQSTVLLVRGKLLCGKLYSHAFNILAFHARVHAENAGLEKN